MGLLYIDFAAGAVEIQGVAAGDPADRSFDFVRL